MADSLEDLIAEFSGTRTDDPAEQALVDELHADRAEQVEAGHVISPGVAERQTTPIGLDDDLQPFTDRADEQ
ncbi:hypothetical protein D5S17_28935 [Pseudonocardiaceae bacterium YIM PH 21723]|nr:hypothetical protein D5S17_28935 [Pseudonocardiaceae bacterium YIM PH 21723]